MHSLPPPHRSGACVFVRLCKSDSPVSSQQLAAILNELDNAMIGECANGKADWLPSPYGVAGTWTDNASALSGAENILGRMTELKIRVAIGISQGAISRVIHPNQVNVASGAMNYAARIAFSEGSDGRIRVDEAVYEAVKDSTTWRGKFEERAEKTVKASSIAYYTLNGPSQNQFDRALVPEATSKLKAAALVLVDIKGYSQKSEKEQQEVVDLLSRMIYEALAVAGQSASLFESAGDGGYMAFSNDHGANTWVAWSFARHLALKAKRLGVRIGLVYGEVVSTEHRSTCGIGVHKADEAASCGDAGLIAVQDTFYNCLPVDLRADLAPTPSKKTPRFLLVNPDPREVTKSNLRWRHVLIVLAILLPLAFMRYQLTIVQNELSASQLVLKDLQESTVAIKKLIPDGAQASASTLESLEADVALLKQILDSPEPPQGGILAHLHQAMAQTKSRLDAVDQQSSRTWELVDEAFRIEQNELRVRLRIVPALGFRQPDDSGISIADNEGPARLTISSAGMAIIKAYDGSRELSVLTIP